jgi:hypothetical protein
MFRQCSPIYCPKCPPVTNKYGRRIDAPLELFCENYSGCSIDFAKCANCERKFQISYTVEVKDILDITKELNKTTKKRNKELKDRK